MSNSRFKRLNLWRYLFFSGVLAVGLCSFFLLKSMYSHTLNWNGNWYSTKTSLQKGVMGSWSFMLSHRALAHNYLDLGTWHGYQEVFLKKSIGPGRLSLDFKLEENAHLVIYFAQNDDTLTAVRISRDPQFPDAFLKISDQEFIEKVPLQGLTLKPDWNHCSFTFINNSIYFTSNGDTASRMLLPAQGIGNIVGFRGSAYSTIIDNIEITDHSQHSLLFEDFGTPFSRLYIPILFFIFVNLLYLNFIKIRKTLLVLTINFAVIGLLLLGFYQFYGQDTYPKGWMIDWGSMKTGIETKENVNERVTARNESTPNKGAVKIMFLGSSQTWGAGASMEGNTFVNRFKDLLSTRDSIEVVCINTGISGINSNEILKLYESEWINQNPEICVIDLSLNDAGNPHFEQNLEKMITLNNDAEITTVLIPEPVSEELPWFVENHEIISKLAKSYNLRSIDIHGYLKQHHDDGFIYWDIVHLTDFGQRLFAERMYDELMPVIRADY